MKECFVCKRCFGDHNDSCDICKTQLTRTLNGMPFFADRYRLDSRLATGTLGASYQGYDVVEHCRVAVKVVLSEYVTASPESVEIFYEEAGASALLHHLNVARVLDYGQSATGFLYLVSEFLTGSSLNRLLEVEGKFGPNRAIALILGVCDGLAAIHKRGRLHRDLKPANLFVVQDSVRGEEIVKILDIGISRIKTPEMLTALPLGKRGTDIIGTPAYMAPEQFESEEVDERSDIYSAGAILYHLVTGQPPYFGSHSDVIRQQAQGYLKPPRELDRSIPDHLEETILRSLENDPEERFQSVVALAAALKNPSKSVRRRMTKPKFVAPDFGQYLPEAEPKSVPVELLPPPPPPPPKSSSKRGRRLPEEMGELPDEQLRRTRRLRVTRRTQPVEVLKPEQVEEYQKGNARELAELRPLPEPPPPPVIAAKPRKKLPPPPPHEDKPEHYLRRSKASMEAFKEVPEPVLKTRSSETVEPPPTQSVIPEEERGLELFKAPTVLASTDKGVCSLITSYDAPILEVLKKADEIKLTYKPSQISPASVVYLYADKFLPPRRVKQFGREMHNYYQVEREFLAASLLTVAIFSLRKRGALKINTVGAIVPLLRKKLQLQEDDKFVLQLVNGTIKPQDQLERAVLESLGKFNASALITVFLNFVAASKQHNYAAAEFLCDTLANELAGFRILERRTKINNQALKNGESIYCYKANEEDLEKSVSQVTEIMQMIVAFKNEPPVTLGNKKIMLFDYIVDYYRHLFLYNSETFGTQ